VDKLNPFALLKRIERLAHAGHRQLPHQIEDQSRWSGIIFRIGTQEVVSALTEIGEVLPYPTVFRIPGAKFWLKGIANFRGNLLTLVDLQGFLNGIPTPRDRRNRVLVVNHAEMSTGFLVDEVIGLRHFKREAEIPLPKTWIEAALLPYLQPGFERTLEDPMSLLGSALKKRYVPIFGLCALIDSPQFMQVAA